MQYFEDLHVGDTVDCGQRTVSRDEIIEYAEQWDPQPFHVDEAAASETIFGDVIASGLHTLSVCSRLAYDDFFSETAVVAGRGIDELRFPRPVRPGDTIFARVEILDRDGSEGPPERGLVHVGIEGHNQRDERVITFISLVMVERELSN